MRYKLTRRSSLLPGVTDGADGGGVFAAGSFFGGGADSSFAELGFSLGLGCSLGGSGARSGSFASSFAGACFSCFSPSDGSFGSIGSFGCDFGSSLPPKRKINTCRGNTNQIHTLRCFSFGVDFAKLLSHFYVIFFRDEPLGDGASLGSVDCDINLEVRKISTVTITLS